MIIKLGTSNMLRSAYFELSADETDESILDFVISRNEQGDHLSKNGWRKFTQNGKSMIEIPIFS